MPASFTRTAPVLAISKVTESTDTAKAIPPPPEIPDPEKFINKIFKTKKKRAKLSGDDPDIVHKLAGQMGLKNGKS